MSDCCGGGNAQKTEHNAPTKRACPSCGKDGLTVPFATMLHHLKTPWANLAKDQPYYFCDDLECETVYFGSDGTAIAKEELRTKMLVKGDADGLACFCYGVSAEDAADPAVKAFIMAQTKAKNCACDRRNPSGRCCLKYFPK